MLLESSRGLYGVISSSSLLILRLGLCEGGWLLSSPDRQTDTAQGIVDDGQDIITESVWTTRMSCQVNSSRAQFFFIFYIIQCTLAAQSSCPVSDCLIHSRIGIICYLLAWETRNRNETQQLNRKIDGLFIQCGYTIVCNPPPLR